MHTSRTLAIAAVAASGLLLAGCKTTTATVTTTAANTGAATAKTSSTTAASSAAAAQSATVGGTINVTDDEGDKLAVTLVKVDASASATDGFSSPDAGDQYYAAQFSIKDVGSTAWSDAPSNCAVVKDGKSQSFQSTIVQSISSGPLMGTTVNLGAGDSALGWIVFEVPTGDKVATVQFTPDSGMGSNTAQWSIG